MELGTEGDLEEAEECLSEARSILECALVCLEELDDPRGSEARRTRSLPSDVGVLIKLGTSIGSREHRKSWI